jgi:hypothetical protein
MSEAKIFENPAVLKNLNKLKIQPFEIL